MKHLLIKLRQNPLLKTITKIIWFGPLNTIAAAEVEEFHYLTMEFLLRGYEKFWKLFRSFASAIFLSDGCSSVG